MAQKNHLRFGVIGAGRIGKLHAKNLATRIPGATVAAIADVNLQAAQELADRLGVPATEADYQELLADPGIDAVAVCSSTDTHAQILIAAAQAGKHIFCEKPIHLDLDTIDVALEAVEKTGVKLQIGFNRRFDPNFRKVRTMVAEDKIGTLHLLRITSRDPAPPPLSYIKVSGGIFLDMTIHDFDMARYVAASEVVDVHARGAVRIDPGFAEAGDVDTALITLQHRNGCLTAIDNSRQAVYGYDQRVEAFGSLGVASSENPSAHGAVVRTANGASFAVLPYFYLERYLPSYIREWEAFVAAVAAGETPAVGVEDAR